MKTFRALAVPLFLGGLALLSGCTSKPTTPERTYGPSLPNQSQTGPEATAPGPSSPLTPPVVESKPLERPHVTLVLGGAGVASFATVGILKRFREEGIVVDAVVATGWPALFALGSAYLPSIHDAEWFAMRIQAKDLYRSGFWERKDSADREQLTDFLQSAFPAKDLADAKPPMVIAATIAEWAEPQVYDRGDWHEPILRTMSVPGIFRPYPEGRAEFAQAVRGIEVDEATKRSSAPVVVITMYDDYFKELGGGKKDAADAMFRQTYLAQLRSSLRLQMRGAAFNGNISLGKPANDFTQKRAAIRAGYREATRIARLVKSAPKG